jgi:hypothetical protein
MDPWSISASVVSLVTLDSRVFRIATRYIKAANESRTEVENPLCDAKDIATLLPDLSLVAYDLEVNTSASQIPAEFSSLLKVHHYSSL